MLIPRSGTTALDVVGQLLGMQSQIPTSPYVGLWARIQGFRIEDLASLLRDRSVVRLAMMRSTIHLVTSNDCLWFRSDLQASMDRLLRGTFGRSLEGLDLLEVAEAGRKLADETPHTLAELGLLLRSRWPDRDAEALANVVRAMVPLVQVLPRGLWGESGLARHTSIGLWLGREPAIEPHLDDLVLRYLSAYGPASVADIQAWSGLTGLNKVVDRLGDRIALYVDEDDNELVDDARMPLADADNEAPVRFLAEFDSAVISHADRRRVITDEHRRAISTKNGLVPGTVLVDGFVRATWKVVKRNGTADLRVAVLERTSRGDRLTIEQEGKRLLEFLATEDEIQDIHLSP